jgi:hypothetical protein
MMGGLNDVTLGGSDELFGLGGAAIDQAGRAAGLIEKEKGYDYGSAGGQTVTTKRRGPDGKMVEERRSVRHPSLAPDEPKDPSALEDYRTNRNSFRSYLKETERENPKSFMAGGLVGSGLTAPLVGGPGGKLTAKGLMTLGGTYGLMSDESDLTTGNAENFKDAAGSTAFGAGASLLLGKGLEQVPKIPGGIRKLGQKIEGTDIGGRIANSNLAKWFKGGTDAIGDAVSETAGRATDAVGEKVRPVAKAVGTELAKWLPDGAPKVKPGTEVDPEGLMRVVDGPPPPGGAPGKSGKGWTMDPEDIDDDMVARFIEKHAEKGQGVMKRLGLEIPDAEDWVLRDLDIQKNARHRMNQKGVDRRAAQELLNDPRYAKAKELAQKNDLVQTKLRENALTESDTLSLFDSLAGPKERFDPRATADRIEREVYRPLTNGPAADGAAAAKVMAEIEKLRALGEKGNLSLVGATDYKRRLDKYAYRAKDDPVDVAEGKAQLRKVRAIVNSEIERPIKAIAERIGKPEKFGEWKGQKQAVGAMAELSGPVAERWAARDSNRVSSLTDYITAGNVFSGVAGGGAGLLSAASGDGPGLDDIGIAAAVAGGSLLGNKWARERGPHVMSQILWKKKLKEMMEEAAKAAK